MGPDVIHPIPYKILGHWQPRQLFSCSKVSPSSWPAASVVWQWEGSVMAGRSRETHRRNNIPKIQWPKLIRPLSIFPSQSSKVEPLSYMVATHFPGPPLLSPLVCDGVWIVPRQSDWGQVTVRRQVETVPDYRLRRLWLDLLVSARKFSPSLWPKMQGM